MNELAKRALYGSLFVAITLGAVFYHPLSLLAYLVVVYVIGVTEMKHLLDASSYKNLFTSLLLTGVFLLWAHLSFSIDFQNHLLPLTGFMIVVLGIQHVFSKGSETDSRGIQKAAFAFLYVFLPLAFVISMAFVKGFFQPKYVLALFFFIWANDTFAYLTGRWIGKHKLLERLSPKKTIEGFAGGLIGALVVGYILSLFWLEMNLIHWLIFAAIVSVVGTIGDLFESALKRSAGVKDAGNLIPGHGGILDRLDSFLFSAPVAYFYLYFFA
jgi:phosphatidate cytidylyltransferase